MSLAGSSDERVELYCSYGAVCRGKPMIISTGIADGGDIQQAVDACRRVGNNEITLLQCTSSYPAPVELANLRMIPNLAETFGVKSGLSDNTPGSAVAVATVALGATMVEKHFILDRNLGGPRMHGRATISTKWNRDQAGCSVLHGAG